VLVRLDGIGRPALDASRYQSSAAILAREYYFRPGGAQVAYLIYDLRA
jgi:hypothetical protein